MNNIQVAGQKLTEKSDAAPARGIGLHLQAFDDRRALKESMVRLFSWWFLSECFVYNYMGPGFSINVGINLSPDRILFILAVLLFCIRPKSPDARPVPISTIEYLMVAFTIASTLSYFIYGSDGNLGKFRWLATLFTLCYQPFMAYYIARRIRFDKAAAKSLLLFLAGIGIYLGITGIFEHYSFTHILVFPKYILDCSVGVQCGRARGPFAAAVVNGGAIIVAFLSAAASWTVMTGAKRTWMFLGMLIMCVTLYLTQTRGVWLGFALVLGIVFMTRTPMRKLAKGLIAVMILGFITGGASKFSLYQGTLFSKRAETVDYRWANYMVELSMFRDNPIFGIGYGNFTKKWREYFGGAESELTSDLADGNNTTLLGILAEMGLTGITLYIAILAIAWKICFSTYRQLKGEDQDFERTLVVVVLGSLMAFLLMGITTDLRFHEFFNSVLFFMLGTLSNPKLIDLSANNSLADSPVLFRKTPSFRTA
jgi:O-antigen ligase